MGLSGVACDELLALGEAIRPPHLRLAPAPALVVGLGDHRRDRDRRRPRRRARPSSGTRSTYGVRSPVRGFSASTRTPTSIEVRQAALTVAEQVTSVPTLTGATNASRSTPAVTIRRRAVADRRDRGGLVAHLHDDAAVDEAGEVGVLDPHPADELGARGRGRLRLELGGHRSAGGVCWRRRRGRGEPADELRGSAPSPVSSTAMCWESEPTISAEVVARSSLAKRRATRPRGSRSGPARRRRAPRSGRGRGRPRPCRAPP